MSGQTGPKKTSPTDKWEISVVGISPGATSCPDSGHFYWQYEHLWKIQQNQEFDARTIARKDQLASHLNPTFGKKAHHFLFSFGLRALFEYRPILVDRRLKSLPQGLGVFVASYDGGFSDFLLVNWLAHKNPEIHFVYNFHWPLQWLAVLRSKSTIGRLLTHLLERVISLPLPNLTFAAETKQLAKALAAFLASDLPVFPIITSFPGHRPIKWENRDFDLLLLPQRRQELEFSKEIAKLAHEKGLKVAILAHSKLRASEDHDGTKIMEEPVEEIWGPLGQEEYSQLLLNSKTAVLPYEKNYGPWMSSGKFNDAIFHGCFPFVPSESAMASQSSIPETMHWYVRASANSALDSVIHVLESGFPKALRAKDLLDLQTFLKDSKKVAKRQHKPARTYPRLLALFFAGLLFSIYREKPRGKGMIHSILRALDSLPRLQKVGK